MKIHMRAFLKKIVWIGAIMLFIFALAAFFIPWRQVEVWAWLRGLNFGTGRVTGEVRYIAAWRITMWDMPDKINKGEVDPKAVVPTLVAHLKDKHEGVRELAALSLGHIHQFPELVVPALLDAIKADERGGLMFIYAPPALCDFGTNARPWSPILVQMVKEETFAWRKQNFLAALAKIDPEVGKPMRDQYYLEISNRTVQAEAQAQAKNAEYAEKQRAKYAELYAESLRKWQNSRTNPPLANTNLTHH